MSPATVPAQITGPNRVGNKHKRLMVNIQLVAQEAKVWVSEEYELSEAVHNVSSICQFCTRSEMRVN